MAEGGAGLGAGAIPPDVRDALARLSDPNANRSDAAVILAAIAHRAANDLHRVARAESLARRDQADWGPWAALANASRDAVLKLAAVRRTAGELGGGGDADLAPPPDAGASQ